MIANVSPGLSCSEHTLNTLRYAERVKELKKEKTPMSKEDNLSRMLMLPRQKANSKQYTMDGTNLKKEKTVEPKVSTGETLEFEEEIVQRQAPQKQPQEHNFKPTEIRRPKKQEWEEERAQVQEEEEFEEEEDQRDRLIEIHQRHQELVDQILSAEEELIQAHKEQIDNDLEVSREEMKLVTEAQSPDSDIKHYVKTLQSVLKHKMIMLKALSDQVNSLDRKLREEQKLSKQFQEANQDDEDY